MSRIFVFRISKGNEPGNPLGSCNLDYSDVTRRINNLQPHQITPIDFENNGHREFIHSQLWEENILRQGWGIEGLDLRNENIHSWISNYMLNARIYWDNNVNCSQAKGRWNILRRILRMNQDDFIIVPKTSQQSLNDHNRFLVCQVDGEYYFDLSEEIQDFGHCIRVKNLVTFNYSQSTLLRGDFRTPYLWAVTEVREHHSRYNRILNFIHSTYLS